MTVYSVVLEITVADPAALRAHAAGIAGSMGMDAEAWHMVRSEHFLGPMASDIVVAFGAVPWPPGTQIERTRCQALSEF